MKHLWHSYDAFQNLLAFSWATKDQKERQADYLIVQVYDMDTFGLTIMLGIDIAGQMSILFVAIST